MGAASILQDPEVYYKNNGNGFVHAVKNGIHFVNESTSPPLRLVPMVRKITEYTGPALAHIGQVTAQWSRASQYFTGLVEAFDLFELIGDLHYFINGGFLQDKIEKRWAVIAARIALVPANLLGVYMFIRDAFNLTFPNLGAYAASIGGTRVFGIVSQVTALAAARAFVVVGHTLLAVNAGIRFANAQNKVNELSKQLPETVSPSDDLKTFYDKIDKTANTEAKETMGKRFVEYKNNRIAANQALIDMLASITEVVLRVLLLAGLAIGVTMTGTVALGVTGAISLLVIGAAAIYKFNSDRYKLTDDDVKNFLGKA